jgi:hypothetical protein
VSRWPDSPGEHRVVRIDVDDQRRNVVRNGPIGRRRDENGARGGTNGDHYATRLRISGMFRDGSSRGAGGAA